MGKCGSGIKGINPNFLFSPDVFFTVLADKSYRKRAEPQFFAVGAVVITCGEIITLRFISVFVIPYTGSNWSVFFFVNHCVLCVLCG